MLEKKQEDQILQSIAIVCEKAPGVQLDYFCKIWTEFWIGVQQPNTPYIAITDIGFPELYIRAAGARPLFLFGVAILRTNIPNRFFHRFQTQ